MAEDVDNRGKELARKRLELSGKVVDILPLCDPDGWYDWKIVRQKILTKEKAAELVRLAQEIQEVREELDAL
ncbi:MAG: hypothetical protein WBC88_04155 [Candidatus Zixiibacteriota bacterium]